MIFAGLAKKQLILAFIFSVDFHNHLAII